MTKNAAYWSQQYHCKYHLKYLCNRTYLKHHQTSWESSNMALNIKGNIEDSKRYKMAILMTLQVLELDANIS